MFITEKPWKQTTAAVFVQADATLLTPHALRLRQSCSSGWNREDNWRLQRPSQKKQSISGKGYDIVQLIF